MQERLSQPMPQPRRLRLDPDAHRGHQRSQDHPRFPCRFLDVLPPFRRLQRRCLFASYSKPSYPVSTWPRCMEATSWPRNNHLLQPVKLFPVQLVQLGVDVFITLVISGKSGIVQHTLNGVLRAWDYNLYRMRKLPQVNIRFRCTNVLT